MAANIAWPIRSWTGKSEDDPVATVERLETLAREIARRAQFRLAVLDREETEIDRRKAEIGTERENIRDAAQRALDFRPVIGADYQCPRCWVDHKKESILQPVASQTGDELFRCEDCSLELEF